MATFRLGDDGTLNTVIVCKSCGEEFRFNFDPADGHAEECTDDSGECACYDSFIDSCIEDCEADHDCEDPEAQGPQAGDITTGDHERFYQDGHQILTRDPDGRWYAQYGHAGTPMRTECLTIDPDYRVALRLYMERTQYWPSCWFISDHGNAHLIDLSEKTTQG